ncbi:MAG: aspartate aminotransferase family protein [Actinobacteria bacterium]|nr:MAG: aspartate aminotransferase family protein [Actinomycetota bacterium]
MPTYPAPPVTFVRGEGTVLWDDQGRCYLDFLSGLGVTSLGHSHPAVAEALAAQAGTLLHVSNLYGTTIAPEVAATLDHLICAHYPDGAPTPSSSPRRGPQPRPAPSAPHGRVFFCNSGAEANECAFKLARKWGGPGRHVVVSAYGSFHGRTLAALHATGQPEKHEAFQPLPEGFRHVAWCDTSALEAALTPEVAAVLLEPILGEGGVRPGTTEFLLAARRLCDERGILLVLDEVQTGLARTGRWFGFQHFGIEPDVVTMAKSLGNGVPIGACWARAEVADAFVPGDHATTFGGQPLAVSAARAVLRVMQEEDAPARAAAAGARLGKALAALPGVAEVRGLGLLLAVELMPDQGSRDAAARALEAGLVVNPVTSTALRLAPPLLVSDEEIDEAVDILSRVLEP